MDERLKQLYRRQLLKTGVAYSGQQLLDFARKKNIKADSSQVHTFLREQQPSELAAFSQAVKEPKHFPTIGVSKPGVYFIDYGEFHKQWAWHNDGCTGFLVAVENLSNRLFAFATKGKATRQWLNSIAQFIELNRNVSVIYSDRDSVATSPTFKEHVHQKYKINWYFLKKGNKSYLAERFIGYIKNQLSKALASKEGPGKRWIDYLKPICDNYNAQVISGTKFRRGQINESNFDSFVEQLFDIEDASGQRYNAATVASFDHHPAWNKAIFKFELGDTVLLQRAANWKLKHSSFAKISQEGAFSSDLFTVSGRQLRADKLFKHLVPSYSLKEFGSNLHFYENELLRVDKNAQAASTWSKWTNK